MQPTPQPTQTPIQTNAQPVQKGFDAKGFAVAARAKGYSDTEIVNYLKQKNALPSQATPPISTPPKSQSNPTLGQNTAEAQLAAGDQITSGFQQVQKGASEGSAPAKNLSDVLNNVGTGAKDIGLGAAHMAAGGIGAVAAPISGAVKSIGALPAPNQGDTNDNVGDRWNKSIQPLVDTFSDNPTVQKLVTKHPSLLEAIPDFLSIALTLMGGKEAPETGSALEDAADSTIKSATPIAKGTGELMGKGADAVVNTVSDVTGKVKEGIKPNVTPKEATGNIIQGKTEDIPAAQRILSNLDHTGIKTYADLQAKLDEQAKSLTKQVDNEFGKDSSGGHSIKSFEQTIGEGKSAVKVNYVKQAIADLKDYYAKTNDAQGLAKIQKLENSAKIKGMTYKDVNDLARLHGKELNAFNANGQAASGLSKQAAENTRSGLKDTARQGLGNDSARALDRQLHETLDTKKLIDKQVESVNKAAQKTPKQGVIPKTIGKVVKGLDVVTGGPLKALGKTMGMAGSTDALSATELEGNLAKNLKSVKGSPPSSFNEGEIPKQLFHQSVGKIEIVDGNTKIGNKGGFGMSKIAEDHPDVVPHLKEGLRNAKIVQELPQRKILEGSISDGRTIRYIIDEQLGTSKGIIKKTFLNNAYFKI